MSTKVTLTREIAYDAFSKIVEKGKNPEQVLEEYFRNHKGDLKRLDRAFVKELLYGSLRWFSKIYWIVQNTAKKNLSDSSAEIRAALVLGTYQIFYMDGVPDRAAVNESVEYIRKKGQAKAVTFVNGILRAIARRAEYFPKPDKDTQPAQYLSLQYAHPLWIVQRWLPRFGFEKTKELLASNNHPPPYAIRMNVRKITEDTVQEFRSQILRDEKNHSEKKALRSCLHLRAAPLLDEGSLFAQGFYTIQDEASQLIANLVVPNGGHIVDACAGKGGKTGHLFELSKGEAELTGIDLDPRQLAKAQETMKRLGHIGIEWVNKDFLEFQPDKPVDKILLDAPCSGLGVLRRHPEGKWQKHLDLVPKMSELQRRLLCHALNIVKPGGELIYSVCSFELEETFDHLKWLEQNASVKFDLISPVSRVPDYYKRFVTRENVLMIYSGNKDAMDGFSAFILRKI
ncbi:MAG: methyltransferase domain-containing protein [Deltaproteobacteria bacterium]|nr:methyltransferase domain-containing protein [Deltaproteobacteria bacterium]